MVLFRCSCAALKRRTELRRRQIGVEYAACAGGKNWSRVPGIRIVFPPATRGKGEKEGKIKMSGNGARSKISVLDL